MKVFLIIVAVLVVLIAIVLSLTATIFVDYKNGWHTKIKVLFIEKEIVLSQLLSFVLFPGETADEAVLEKKYEKEKSKSDKDKTKNATEVKEDLDSEKVKDGDKPVKKKNIIKDIYDKDGIVGILNAITTMVSTMSSAVQKFFKVFHIHDLYVKMIIGGNDAADISESYGMVSSIYYPLIGIIRNGMTIDNFDEIFFADFIAPKSEYEFNLVASLSVRNLLQILFKAGFTFLAQFIKDKK